MSKKQVMKEIFEEKINQDRIYQKVLLKVEEEASMNRIGNKKMIYGILSSCAMVIVCAVIITNGKFGIDKAENKNQITATNDKYVGIEDLREEKQSREININKIEEMQLAKIDAEIKTANNFINIPYYEVLSNLTIPKDFESKEYINIVYIKSDRTKKEYDKLFNYQKIYKNTNNNRSITIEYSKENKPMKDYHFEGEKTSKINDFEIIIYQYENSYITSFTYDNLNIDIETNDITQDELIALLESIIKEKNNVSVEEKDTHVNEQPNENKDSNYPDYYAGKYVDNKGNNVVLLCEDNKANRKEICNKLEITESKTIFKTAKYSYNYLTNLQNKISKKMIDKEFTFVTTSAVMEDNNNIKVTVISNNESDLNKIKALDTIGGAIEIQYNENGMSKTELLVEKE